MKALVPTLVTAVCLTAVLALQAAPVESKLLLPGSWAIYSLQTPNIDELMNSGGSSVDPAMLANLPPEKRAQVEAGMKAGKGMSSGMKDMMKEMEMKMKFAVVGEEVRNGKPCIWLETSISGKFPDMRKMMAQMSQGMPPEKQKEMESKMADAEKKIAANPVHTKDGRLKYVLKMLIRKPDRTAKTGMRLAPLEAFKKEGDNPAVKLSGDELGALTCDTTREAESSNTKMDVSLQTESSDAEASSGIVGQCFATLGSIMKKSDVQVKTETQSESETMTRVKERSSKVIGKEDLTVVKLGKIKVLHTQSREVREMIIKVRGQSAGNTPVKSVNTDVNTTFEQVSDMYVSPVIPPMSLARVVMETQQGDVKGEVSVTSTTGQTVTKQLPNGQPGQIPPEYAAMMAAQQAKKGQQGAMAVGAQPSGNAMSSGSQSGSMTMGGQSGKSQSISSAGSPQQPQGNMPPEYAAMMAQRQAAGAGQGASAQRPKSKVEIVLESFGESGAVSEIP